MAVRVELSREALTCGGCGTQLSLRQLACPVCHRLVHGVRLAELAEAAGRAQAEGRPADALARWREAQALVPAGARQLEQISARITALSKEVEKAAFLPPGVGRIAAGAGAVALFVWKFKVVVAFALTKGKLLLAGLLNAKTLLSMFVAVGAYWTLWGWKFALGLVLTIYVHEIGHVAALKRLGIAAGAPMFIPGFGAFVRLEQYPNDAREDARVGLAGPIWGLGAALACLGLYFATSAPFFAGLAHATAWMNLFNLIPIWQLDGGRGFRALTRRFRLYAIGAVGAAWFFTGESLLVLVLAGAVYRLFTRDEPKESDPRAFGEFVGLIALLSALSWLGRSLAAVAL